MSKRRLSHKFLVEVFLFVLLALYVLSYAPVVRVCEGTSPSRSDDYILARGGYPLYHPVDLLIDLTPLRKPLFFWADIWGVRDCFEHRHGIRRANADTLRAQHPATRLPNLVDVTQSARS